MTDPTPTPETREPEALLLGINQSIFTKALLVSLVAHTLLLGGTSFALYRDWAEHGVRSEQYGFHTPSTLKTIKLDLIKEEEDAQRRAREEERLADQRARAMAEADAEPTPAPRATTPGAPPAEPEIDPLPRRAFSLDDVGLDL